MEMTVGRGFHCQGFAGVAGAEFGHVSGDDEPFARDGAIGNMECEFHRDEREGLCKYDLYEAKGNKSFFNMQKRKDVIALRRRASFRFCRVSV